MTVGRSRLVTVLFALAALLLLGAAQARRASAATNPGSYLVTFAARACPSYSDIAQNRAQNNLQESLENLGAPSDYTGSDFQVNPATEAAQQPDPPCTPITGWHFTMGTSYQSAAVHGPWGALSKVTSPFATPVVTQDRTPLLNTNGDPTGADLPGAVTIPLTSAEAAAASRNGLWVQGGTPDDPVLNSTYPGEYGFGSLRCAIDALNGDNVEFVGFPLGVRHVFCFAYYVTPPPTSGTIIVRKQIGGSITSATTPFQFNGDISYTPDQNFTISAGTGHPGQMTFYRAASGARGPWSFREIVPQGYTLTGLTCESQDGASTTATDLATGAASVTLAAGDTVTCTYTDAVTPPPADLELSKTTLGGTGSFDFDVTGSSGTQQRTITTTDPGVAVNADPVSLAPGSYRLREDLPAPTSSGHWTLDSVRCDGADQGTDQPFSLTLAAGQGKACAFTDSFVPSGSITLRKTTLGATGTASFLVRRIGGDDPTASYSQTATTSSPGQPTLATGDDTSQLALGTYEIIETTANASRNGVWNLDSVLCDGEPVGTSAGVTEVTLTAADPSADCTFVDQFTPGALPPDPTYPGGPPTTAPTPPGKTPPANQLKPAGGPFANLSITKTVSPKIAHPGQAVTYRIVVTNHGPNIAYGVVGTEVSSQGRRRITIVKGTGECTTRFPARCHVHRLAPGHRIVILVHTHAPGPGRYRDVVAVSSVTRDTNLRDNRASAVLIVRHARHPPPRFTG